jgi:dihydroorotase
VDDDAKLLPFTEAEAGASCLELLLPLTLKWAADNKASMFDAVAKITALPANILAIAGGHLSLNADADIAIFNPTFEWSVSANQLKSHGKNTPFLGLAMHGRVQTTLLHGQIVYQIN